MQVEVITGPTASGKTELALERAASDPNIEIVNSDASLFYKGFDVGTAKPSKEIRQKIPHDLIDILEPHERFSAGEYSEMSRKIIRDIISRNKIPLVVGGTGFYIDALFFGISDLEVDDEALNEARKRIAREIKELGFDRMHQELKEIDPILYEQVARERNPRRLERAWEFYYATGIALGEARKDKPEPFEYKPSFTILEVEREELRERIAKRIDAMLAGGWLSEVEQLLGRGVTPEMPAMNAIGYRELTEVIRGEKKLKEVREEIIIRTRQYAKRQETWMKRYKQNVHQTQ